MANKGITVFNSAHSGYRRAGLVFNKGDNVIDGATKAQIHAITNDKRLVLQDADKAKSTAQKELVAGNNSLQQSLEVTGNGSGETLPEILPSKHIAFIVSVILACRAAEKLELTGTGKPTTACLENAVEDDVQISASMRDEAWNFIQANPDYQIEQTSPGVGVTESETTEVETPEAKEPKTEPATSETSSEGSA